MLQIPRLRPAVAPCLSLTAVAMASVAAGARLEAQPMADFRPVAEARIDAADGVPRLLIDGRPTPPLIFFANTDVPGPASERYLAEQVQLAASAGVHLYSLPLRCPRQNEGRDPNYTWGEGLLDRFIRVDPEALFILRVYPGPWPFWREWRDIPADHIATFADGTQGRISIASDYFWDPSDQDFARLIRHFESSAYGGRILCYQPGGPEHEMFLDQYREKGPDYSEVNQQRFRRWLTATYGTDEALRAAWGGREVSLTSAGVPRFEAGRFPMHGARGGETVQFFYEMPRERDWIDFSEYCSDIVSDRIIDWARLVKRETEGRKLSAFFYGYTFELPGSFSGHYALRRVLACPEVDVLASPYSYRDRFGGGAGNFMSLVDTVTAHGKLWINEDDTRTHLIDRDQLLPQWALFNVLAQDEHETLSILDRNFGSILAHRAGTWWMDLAAAGAFNHPAPWQMLEKRRVLYEDIYRDPQPYRPEVGVIVHERSKLTVKSDWDANYWTMYQLRDEAAKSGASVGYYSLADFTDDVSPPCKAYVFANAFWPADEQIAAVRERLDREQALAVWIYAPGYLAPDGPDVARSRELTGIALAVGEGGLASEGVGRLAGERWGPDLPVTPRLVVTDDVAETLGRYVSDGAVSAAAKPTGRHRAVFLGSPGPSRGVLTRLFEQAGAHIWAREGEVVQTDGSVLMVHTGRAGTTTVHVPAGVTAEPLFGVAADRRGQTLRIELPAGGTCWFRLVADSL